MEHAQLIGMIRRFQLPLHDEKQAQAALHQHLTEHGIEHDREVRLSDQDVVDFMVDGTAVELKLKGSRMAIYRQIERYAQHDSVKAIILLTARAMGLPPEINGKPAVACSMSGAWL